MSTTKERLNDVMSFDHIIEVHEDGSITDRSDLWAPELIDDEIERKINNDWEFFSTGYSGQDRYSGPIMHNSEFIGGQLERDILATPGVYVAVASYYSVDTETDHVIITSDITGEAHCESCGFGGCDDEPVVEGWAVLKAVQS